MERFGDMAITEDLRMCLESEMLLALQEAVDRGWYDAQTAETEFLLWRSQFSNIDQPVDL